MPGDCEPELVGGGTRGQFQIIDGLNCKKYTMLPRPDITLEKFNAWVPSGGWVKAGGFAVFPRYLTSAARCRYATPGFNGFESTEVKASEPWADGPATWEFTSHLCPGLTVLGGCFPAPCSGLDTPQGSLRYVEIANCVRVVWDANMSVNILTDPDENQYIMTATMTEDNAASGVPVGAAKLPPGWTRETMMLAEDLELVPTPEESSMGQFREQQHPFGEYPCGYAVLQDFAGNLYLRFVTTNGNRNILPQLKLILNGYTPNDNWWRRILIGIIAMIVIVFVAILACRYFTSSDEAEPSEEGQGEENEGRGEEAAASSREGGEVQLIAAAS